MSKFNLTTIKLYQVCQRYLLVILAAAGTLISCEDDYETDADDLLVPLTHEVQQIKAPGRGQYKLASLSGEPIVVKADLTSFQSLRSLTITKTMNLATDPSFGTNGVLTVDVASIDSEYLFQYTPPITDVDQLVDFMFQVEDASGNVITSDLQLIITVSPRDNLPRRKWLWKSKIWVDKDNLQDIKECEKDNYYLFNSDGTMSLQFGANTGTPGCDFDGFNVYDTWTLSEDETVFTMVYHSIFAPDTPLTETYRVKTLTTDKLELEIDYDLVWAGEGPEETFLFEFTALPK